MAIEGVVLYIGGGEAQHSAEMLRMQNFFHFRGQEGWLTASSGVASENATPGTALLVSPGPFLINSRFPGGAMQSYMGRILTGTTVETTAVPPGAGRSDLLVMNIEDPYPTDGGNWPYPGAPGSDSRRQGPYATLRVIPGVPDNTLSLSDLPVGRTERDWTAIPICRLDRPANTGTVTNAMIIPLRAVINPWAGIQLPQAILNQLDQIDDAVSDIGDFISGIKNQKFPAPAIATSGGQCYYPASQNTVFVSDTTWKDWPKESLGRFVTPPWANYVYIYVDIICAYFQTGSLSAGIDANVYMGIRYKAGNSVSQVTYNELVEPNDVYYGPCPDKRANRPPNVVNIKLATNMYIQPQDRGKVVTGGLQIQRSSLPGGRLYNGVLVAIPQVTSSYCIREFKELPQ